jgi:hypothetical protein
VFCRENGRQQLIFAAADIFYEFYRAAATAAKLGSFLTLPRFLAARLRDFRSF